MTNIPSLPDLIIPIAFWGGCHSDDQRNVIWSKTQESSSEEMVWIQSSSKTTGVVAKCQLLKPGDRVEKGD